MEGRASTDLIELDYAQLKVGRERHIGRLVQRVGGKSGSRITAEAEKIIQ